MRKNTGPHVERLMHGHHRSGSTPADILMRGSHRAMGGSMGMPSAMPSMSAKAQMYKEGGSAEEHRRGGRAHHHKHRSRHHHAMGEGVNPVSGHAYPAAEKPLRKGGRACHAQGDMVEAQKQRRGGRTHGRHHREHHFLGEIAGNVPIIGPGLKSALGLFGLKEGGQPEVPYKKGGHAHHHRRHRSEGGEMREHHDLGELVGQLAPLAAHLLPMLLKNGGRAHRRRHHEEGDTVAEKHRRGGRAHHHRRHHADGDEVEMRPLKRAMGGAGKVRKGIMNEDGSLR